MIYASSAASMLGFMDVDATDQRASFADCDFDRGFSCVMTILARHNEFEAVGAVKIRIGKYRNPGPTRTRRPFLGCSATEMFSICM